MTAIYDYDTGNPGDQSYDAAEQAADYNMARPGADRQRLTFTAPQLDLLDDIIEYYVMSDFGGGDHSALADQATIRAIQDRVTAARERSQS
jgi:hypothetical protein